MKITGHGHPSPFCQNGWDGLASQPSKGCLCKISISEKKRNQAMEGKGVEMEPLNKQGLLIHAFS